MKKKTEELINEIKTAKSVEEYFAANEKEFVNLSLSAFLSSKLEERKIKKSDLFRRAGQEGSNYGYELFRNDDKAPSRNILISICLAFPLSIEDTQMALRCAGLSLLYPRDERDAYILYAIKKKMKVEDLDEILEEHGMETIL